MNFPPYTFVTASSEGELGGCEQAETADFSGGIFAQYIPVGSNRVDSIELLLATDDDDCSAEIVARVIRCESPGQSPAEADLRRPLAEETLHWAGSGPRWVAWPVNLTPLAGMKVGSFLRVELELPPGIGWVRNRQFEPASPAAVAPAGESRNLAGVETTFCFRVEPSQPCFWAANVLPETSGVHRFTGAWKSASGAGFPQWLEVSWRDPYLMNELEMHFPDSPECPTAYRVEITSKRGDLHALAIEKNRLTRVTHRFDSPLVADCVRIELQASRGGSSVSLEAINASLRPLEDPGGRA